MKKFSIPPSAKWLCTSALIALAAGQAHARDLVIAVNANIEPANFDFQVDPYMTTMMFDSFMTDPLIVLAPDRSLKPGLATSWEESPDAMVFTLHLRAGVTFQDGTPFDADAVVYNFQRILDKNTGSALLASNVGPLEKIEAVDPLMVRFTYSKPWVTFFDMATKAPMWSPTAQKTATPQTSDKHLVGTGPFKMVEWVPNDHVRMERWAEYGGWNGVQDHKGAAQVDGVVIRFIGESSVLGDILSTGEADIAYDVPQLSADGYKNSPDYHVYSIGQSGTGLQMVMNVTKPPLNDVRVRQALLYGRDMKAANDTLYDGLYGASDGPLDNIHPCYWDGAGAMYPFDQAKAQALLDAAGWVRQGDGPRVAKAVPGVADGTPLSVRWTVLHHQEIAEFVQAQLKQIGVDLKVEVVPGPVQLERVQKRDFDLMYERLRSPDPQILDDIWNPAYDQPGGWYWTGYRNPELLKALDIIRTNPDNTARCTAAKAAQELIMNDAVMFPTLAQPTIMATTSKVKGFKAGPEGTRFFLHDVSLSD